MAVARVRASIKAGTSRPCIKGMFAPNNPGRGYSSHRARQKRQQPRGPVLTSPCPVPILLERQIKRFSNPPAPFWRAKPQYRFPFIAPWTTLSDGLRKVTACDSACPSSVVAHDPGVTLTQNAEPCRQPQCGVLRLTEKTLYGQELHLRPISKAITGSAPAPRRRRNRPEPAQSLPLRRHISNPRSTSGHRLPCSFTKARSSRSSSHGMQLLPAPRSRLSRRASAEILRKSQVHRAGLQTLRLPAIWIESQSEIRDPENGAHGHHRRRTRDSSPQPHPHQSPRPLLAFATRLQEEIRLCVRCVQGGLSFRSRNQYPEAPASKWPFLSLPAPRHLRPHRIVFPKPSPPGLYRHGAAYISLPLHLTPCGLNQPVILIGVEISLLFLPPTFRPSKFHCPFLPQPSDLKTFQAYNGKNSLAVTPILLLLSPRCGSDLLERSRTREHVSNLIIKPRHSD